MTIMKPKYYIRTRYGAEYHVTEDGCIIRLDQPGFKPSGQWKLRGLAQTAHPFGRTVVTFDRLDEWLTQNQTADFSYLYKNGKPRYIRLWTLITGRSGFGVTPNTTGSTTYGGWDDLPVREA